MYDPEYSLELEKNLTSDQIRLERVKERCGENHPWTQRVQLVTDILETISQKENDLMNCWNEARREAIQFEIDELLKITKYALKTLLRNGISRDDERSV